MSGTIFFESSEISVGEKEDTVFIAIIRQGDVSSPVEITYEVTSSSTDPATFGADYSASEPLSTVLMDAGADRVVIPIAILDDLSPEPTESFVMSLISVTSGELLAPRTARVDILDDENPAQDPVEPRLESNYLVNEEAVIAGLSQPINFDFSPMDQSLVYVAEKSGLIKVYNWQTGDFVSTFIDLTDEVNDRQDRGLLDIAIHPDFSENPYIYAFYVVDPPDTVGLTGNAGPDGDGNRFAYVVRLEADPTTNYTTLKQGADARVILVGGAGQSLNDISGSGLIDSTLPSTADPDSPDYAPSSDVDPISGSFVQDYIKVDSRSHAGGALAFGPDGALYVSIGDGTSFNFADPRTVTVQDINSLSGKILRIDPMTGDGLLDNPFVDAGTSLDSNAAKVYQLGLRNPFSISFDQNGRLFITDTGWNSYEEVNSGGPGANFGWPFYEGGDGGELAKNSYRLLPEAEAFFDAVASGSIEVTPPFRAFSHATADPGFQVQAITGGDLIYGGTQYPAELMNDFFFTDFSQGEVYSVDVNDRRDVKFIYKTDTGLAPVHLAEGPDGFIYVADIISGEIRRLNIDTNYLPVANLDAGATASGTTVWLDVLANDTDPEGALLEIISASEPANGTVFIDDNSTPNVRSDDRIRYTPNDGFLGIDTFTYDVSDGERTNVGSVSVAVGEVLIDEDFETTPVGWSSDRTVSVLTPSGATSEALGQFGAGAVAQKTFWLPSATAKAVVAFDFYELDSWDGNSGDGVYVTVNGEQVLFNELFHQGLLGSDGNDVAAQGQTGSVAWMITPITDNAGDLGGSSGTYFFTDQIHRVILEIDGPRQSLTVGIGSTTNQHLNDESFAIDNFQVLIVPSSVGEAPAGPSEVLPPYASVVSYEDFEAAAEGWSSNKTVSLLTSSGEATTALGRFGSGETTQKVFEMPGGTANAVVAFDFYELDSWDGTRGDGFYVSINGEQVLYEDFFHQGLSGSDGNDAAAQGQTDSVGWTITPITDNTANLGGSSGEYYLTDQIHRVTLEVQDPGAQLALGFGSTLDQNLNDESFAIDNLEIVALPTLTFAESFEGATEGWSSNKTVSLLTSSGEATTALGRFGSGETTQKIFEMPGGTANAVVAFDFYELDSWDGTRGDGFYVSINGEQVLYEDFFHQGLSGSDGNDAAAQGQTDSVGWTITPITDNTANLGGSSGEYYLTDQIHRVTLEVQDPGAQLALGFGSTLDQNLNDESFAIDNLEIVAIGSGGDFLFI